MATTLEQQLIKSEKHSEMLRKKIEAQKPKDITQIVKTFKDVLKIAKSTKEELAIINYAGKSHRLLFAKYTMRCALITEVLNQGWYPKFTSGEYRWIPIFNVRSGFVFSHSFYGYDIDFTSVGSGLVFEKENISNFAGKTFTKEFENLHKYTPIKTQK